MLVTSVVAGLKRRLYHIGCFYIKTVAVPVVIYRMNAVTDELDLSKVSVVTKSKHITLLHVRRCDCGDICRPQTPVNGTVSTLSGLLGTRFGNGSNITPLFCMPRRARVIDDWDLESEYQRKHTTFFPLVDDH